MLLTLAVSVSATGDNDWNDGGWDHDWGGQGYYGYYGSAPYYHTGYSTYGCNSWLYSGCNRYNYGYNYNYGNYYGNYYSTSYYYTRWYNSWARQNYAYRYQPSS